MDFGWQIGLGDFLFTCIFTRPGSNNSSVFLIQTHVHFVNNRLFIMKKIILVFAMLLTPHAIAADAKWSFGFHVGYSPTYFSMMNITGTEGSTPYTDSYFMEFEGASEIGIDIFKMPRNDWGFIFAAEAGKARKLTKLTDKNNQTYTPQPGQEVATFQTGFIRIGAVYRWDIAYIPVGITYGMTAMTMPSSGTLEVKGGPGMFFGIGWNLDDTIAIEYIGRSTLTQYTYKNNTTTETGTGVIGANLLNLKILF